MKISSHAHFSNPPRLLTWTPTEASPDQFSPSVSSPELSLAEEQVAAKLQPIAEVVPEPLCPELMTSRPAATAGGGKALGWLLAGTPVEAPQAESCLSVAGSVPEEKKAAERPAAKEFGGKSSTTDGVRVRRFRRRPLKR